MGKFSVANWLFGFRENHSFFVSERAKQRFTHGPSNIKGQQSDLILGINKGKSVKKLSERAKNERAKSGGEKSERAK